MVCYVIYLPTPQQLSFPSRQLAQTLGNELNDRGIGVRIVAGTDRPAHFLYSVHTVSGAQLASFPVRNAGWFCSGISGQGVNLRSKW